MSDADTTRPAPFELELERYPFTLEIPTRFGDMDINAHINNVAIDRLFEEARVRFGSFSRGHSLNELRQQARFVTASTLINYLQEIFYPDPVEVGVGITRLGTSSYSLGCLMRQREKPVAHCRTVLVRSENGAASPLPDSIREALQSQLIRRD